MGVQTDTVSIVIPAWNEEAYITDTLSSLNKVKSELGRRCALELIVVDDGSTDGTADSAYRFADQVVRHPSKYGKGCSLMSGLERAKGDYIVFLDADLGSSASYLPLLLEPVLSGGADMTVAKLPAPQRKGGLGLVKGLAVSGIHRLSGFRSLAPLSGQRALRTSVVRQIGTLAGGFGVEVGLTIDAVRLGYKVVELEVPFAHRETGRDLRSWLHRGRQLISVSGVLCSRWWRS
ncbi:glycosyltransferase family 2 protein [Paenibacillus thalictri]|uniref:Glucosyl-3-phosphoglycerate synthase n=1 Tax=Paenibacillus thalictri TaxID=2527873 RepID=A0A4Q9DVV7_9BACL|nr:glycosyltransferase family 2 protein [Paenibacillus thalictri]TBL79838.1 glycosyltransferase family 2 protein [Paenibacillus thalictri]